MLTVDGQGVAQPCLAWGGHSLSRDKFVGKVSGWNAGKTRAIDSMAQTAFLLPKLSALRLPVQGCMQE